MKTLDLTLTNVLIHFEKEVKKIDNFDYKLANGTWSDHDVLIIKDLQYKANGFNRLDKLIEVTSTGSKWLHTELSLIKALLK